MSMPVNVMASNNLRKPDWKLAYSEADFEAGAGALWNDANTTNTVIIDNSIISAKNIDIKAHTVDLTANETDAYAELDVYSSAVKYSVDVIALGSSVAVIHAV